MARQFDYAKKETYTQADLDAIIAQHAGYLNVDKLQADLKALTEEVTPVRQAARKTKITGLLPKSANKDLLDDIMSLAGIAAEDSDDVIKSKLESTVKSRAFLQAPKADDSTVTKVEKYKTIEDKKPLSKEQEAKKAALRNI